jgi:hypothetical protein
MLPSVIVSRHVPFQRLKLDMQLAQQSKSNIADQVGLMIDRYKYKDVLGFGRRTCSLKVN